MKSMNRTITIALFTTLMAPPMIHGEVRLMMDETTVLPGTPTGFTIVVRNRDKTALQLPDGLWLVATDEDVETFRVSAYNVSDSAAIAVPREQRTVPPGETREFRFDPSPVLVASPWFTDGSLSRPGKYRLRAVFAPNVDDNGDFNAAHALASKEELLTIAAESPDDAAVWEWMRATGGEKWGQGQWMQFPEEFTAFVWKKYPESSYALYAVIFLPVEYHSQKDRLLAEQASRFPQKSYSDQLRLRIVYGHQQRADTLRHSDRRAAADEAETGRKVASELAANSRSSTVRTEARRLLAAIPPREVWMRQAQER